MSYGMTIAVQRSKNVQFDALWNQAMSYKFIVDVRHPSYGVSPGHEKAMARPTLHIPR